MTEPCQYCRPDFNVREISIGHVGANAVIFENRMVVCTSLSAKLYPIEIPIHYCPMCGRKLDGV